MYAIRSYYDTVCQIPLVGSYQISFGFLTCFPLGCMPLSVGSSTHRLISFPRITSYNVCYTKLLRARAHNIGTKTIPTLKVTYTAYIWDTAVGEYVTLDFWNTFTQLEPDTWQVALALDTYYLHIDSYNFV